jgi:hypothetical protein
VPWPEKQRRAIAAQKMREAKAKGLSDAEARAYVSAFFRKHDRKRS